MARYEIWGLLEAIRLVSDLTDWIGHHGAGADGAGLAGGVYTSNPSGKKQMTLAMKCSKLLENALPILLVVAIAISLAVVCAAQQCAQVPILTFEGLKDQEPVLNYYNGGYGANGTGPGPNYGITFEGQSEAIISDLSSIVTPAGPQMGTGHFSNAPSGVTVAFFLSGSGVVMNVPAGFTTGFSVYYAAANTAGSITVYEGLDATGNVLATIPLPINGANCGPATYSCWTPVGVPFNGVAKSVDFSGAANYIAFDNITVGSTTPGLIASMAQLASAGGWDTSFTLVNMGSAAACSSLQFYADPNGAALSLPFTFPQGVIAPTTTSDVVETINPDALLVMDTTGPAANTVNVGWAYLQAAGDIGGYGIFTNTPNNWEAVVPLETRNANFYVLPFDNTGVLATGLAIANLSIQPATVNVSIRNDGGFQIDNETIQMNPLGHAYFLLASEYQATSGIRGSVVFSSQSGGQISVLGLRANGPALTTVPVLADVTPGTGSMAHVTYNGGWNTTITLVNTGTAQATPTLSFYGDDGTPLAIPLSYPQTGTVSNSASIQPTLAPGQVLIMETTGQDAQASVSGSAVLSSLKGAVGGSAIFRYSPSGQEGIVPLETRNATTYFLGFDNTNGRVTGMALANDTSSAANLALTIRDDTGATIATDSIALKANGHTQTVLTTGYPATGGKRGTVEIDGPAGFSALGLFVSPTGNVTTLPTLKK